MLTSGGVGGVLAIVEGLEVCWLVEGLEVCWL